MNLNCLLRGHRAAATVPTYNGGYYFSRCGGCGSDMVRSGGAWQTVPAGHRVVWKATRAGHSVEPNFGSHLPVLHPDANLPAVSTPRLSWKRALVALGQQPKVTVSSEQTEEEASPPLIVLIAVWAGLQLLFALRPGHRAA